MSSIKKNIIYNILLQVSNILFPLLTFPYISRVLGPEGLGLANFAQNFCLYFILFATLGIPIYGNREIAKAKEDREARSRVFLEITCIKLLTSLLVLLPYFIIILTSEKFSVHLVFYLWGAFYILADVLSIEWFFSGMENFKMITIRSVVVKLLYVISLFIFVKDSSDVLIYFVIIIFSSVVNGLVNIQYVLRFLSWKRSFTELQLKPHIKPLTLLFSYFLATSMYTMLDTILLGLLATNTAVGFYTAAMRLIKICLTFTNSMGQVLVPRLTSEVAKSNFEEISRLLNTSISFVLTIGIPMMVGLFILAPEVIAIFSGEEFEPAIRTLRILSLLIFIIGLANVFAVQILIPMAKDKLLLIGSLIGGVISISLNFLLIPFLQHDGAAITIVAAESVVMLFAYWFARKLLKFDFSLKTVSVHLLSVLPYFLVAYLARQIFHQAILIALTTISCCVILFLFTQIVFFRNKLVIGGLESVLAKWPGAKKNQPS